MINGKLYECNDIIFKNNKLKLSYAGSSYEIQIDTAKNTLKVDNLKLEFQITEDGKFLYNGETFNTISEMMQKWEEVE